MLNQDLVIKFSGEDVPKIEKLLTIIGNRADVRVGDLPSLTAAAWQNLVKDILYYEKERSGASEKELAEYLEFLRMIDVDIKAEFANEAPGPEEEPHKLQLRKGTISSFSFNIDSENGDREV